MTLRSPSVFGGPFRCAAVRKVGAATRRVIEPATRTASKARNLLHPEPEEETPVTTTATAKVIPSAVSKKAGRSEASRVRNELPEAPPASARKDEDEYPDDVAESVAPRASSSTESPASAESEEFVESELGSMSPEPATGGGDVDSATDSTLSRYFRDMATHQVMGPDEEQDRKSVV